MVLLRILGLDGMLLLTVELDGEEVVVDVDEEEEVIVVLVPPVRYRYRG